MLAFRVIPPGLGDRKTPCSAGLGDVPFPTLLIFSLGGLSGLVDVEAGALGMRCCRGRGEMGIFSRKHSSGTSSPSSSSHSFSNSFAVFLSRLDCQLPLLLLKDVVERLWCGLTPIFGLELRFLLVIGTIGLVIPRPGSMDPLFMGINPKPSALVTLLT
jgi:hypothetical protein